MRIIYHLVVQTAWWAPTFVLCLHQFVQIIELRSQTDPLIHFLGGLAITLFIWTLCPFAGLLFGNLGYVWRILVTFGGGCSAALIWELAEFASDKILNTAIQHTIDETMWDLTNGFAGCILVCLSIASSKLSVVLNLMYLNLFNNHYRKNQ